MRPGGWLPRSALKIPFRLNRDSQQAKGLVFWAPLVTGRAFDYVSGQTLTAIGTTTAYSAPIAGRNCWQINGANGDGLYLNSTLATAAPLSLVAWGYSTSDSGNQVAVSIGDTAADTEAFVLRYSGNVAGDPLRAGTIAGGTERVAVTTVAYPINQWSHAAAVYPAANSRAIFLNGQNKATNGTSSTPASLDRIGIGYRATLTTAFNFVGYLADVRVYNRALSDAEVWALYDPATRWELFEPVAPVWTVGKRTTNAYTMPATVATFSLSGQAANLKAARTLSAAQATLTLSGQAANLLAQHKLTAAQATFSVSGQAATLKADRRLSAAHATFTATGQAAALKLARLLSATQAAFALSGQAANLVYTPVGSYTLIASQATFALSGQAAELLVARLLSAVASAYTVQGQSAALLAARLLSANYGAYTLSGQSVVLNWSGAVAPVTPIERLLAIEAENRALAIAADLRLFTVAGEIRVTVIGGENRTLAVDAENRID